jgi:hypothetical protein
VTRDTSHLRAVIAGLLGFAAAEEEMLLIAGAEEAAEPGAPDRWAAVPLLAHTTEFKSQQAERIRALRSGHTPPAFGEIDHSSAAVYAAYSSQPAERVIEDSRVTTAALHDGVRELADEDLLDPSRHAWLNGRTLWLQVIVRGFWHPAGHIADYYLRNGRPERAVGLQSHALATARYLGAPDQAAGMAAYGLACAQVQAGVDPDEAARVLALAISLNADLRANASRDPDLAPLRDSGQLTQMLA